MVHKLLNLYKCDKIAKDLDPYFKEIIQEIYVSYVATL